MAKRLKKIYPSQMAALTASKKKKGTFDIKPTKNFFLGYQLVKKK